MLRTSWQVAPAVYHSENAGPTAGDGWGRGAGLRTNPDAVQPNTTAGSEARPARTDARAAHAGDRRGECAGGLSGAPVTELSTLTIARLCGVLGDRIPVIGVGGILEGEDAVDKFRAGAQLVQVYSGFIYRRCLL